MKLELKNEWSTPGAHSRFKQWNYAIDRLCHWFGQKKYKSDEYIVLSYCQRFARKYQFKGSQTDCILLAYQNFQLFREFVNESEKTKQ